MSKSEKSHDRRDEERAGRVVNRGFSLNRARQIDPAELTRKNSIGGAIVEAGDNANTVVDDPTASTEEMQSYRSQLRGAWIESRMERDKSLLAVSSGGIGLLVTLLAAFGTTSSLQQLLYGSAFLGFAFAVVFAVLIFGKNASYMEKLLADEENKEGDKSLKWLDRSLLAFFFLGMTSVVILGAYTLLNSADPVSATQPNEQPIEQSQDGIDELLEGDQESEQSGETSAIEADSE